LPQPIPDPAIQLERLFSAVEGLRGATEVPIDDAKTEQGTSQLGLVASFSG
jgi:hypothetical protein